MTYEKRKDKQLIANLERETSEQADEIERLEGALAEARAGNKKRTMTDEERRELCKNLRALSSGYSKMDGSYVEIGLEAADEIERLERVIENMGDKIERLAALAQSNAEPDAQKKLEEAIVYAEHLAISLGARWYPEVSQWKPLSGDLIGLLTQIDNMTTGAVRAQSDAKERREEELLEDERLGAALRRAQDAEDRLAALAALPRPDASAGLAKEVEELQRENKVLRAITRGAQKADASAGLIEAAEMAEECSSECLKNRKAPFSAYALLDFAKLLRARAADRSAEDKPLGFRTWDVPNPYAEGPQSDDEPGSQELVDNLRGEIERLRGEIANWELWAKSQPSYQDQVGEIYDKIKGHAVTQSDTLPSAALTRHPHPQPAQMSRAEMDRLIAASNVAFHGRSR